jgi:sec-independent protein translocase protein TatA
MGELSPLHWAIVIGVLVLLFGSKRLPEAARAVGQSLRVLRAETGALREPAGAVPEQGREETDAVPDRTSTAAGVDRARGGDGGVPGSGAADDHRQPTGDR